MMLWLFLACEGEGVLGDAVDTDSPLEDTAPEWSQLRIDPDGVAVFPGAQLPVRVTIDGPEGRVDLDAEVEVSGPGILVDGVLTTSDPGEVLLVATAHGLEAQGVVEVRDDGLLTVTVVDDAGAAVPDARVVVAGDRVDTGSDGIAQISVPDAPITITVYGDDVSQVPATFVGVQGRRVVLPLRSAEGRSPDSVVSGTVDFGATLAPEDGQLGIAIAGRTLIQHPLLLNADELLGDKREVEVIGLKVDVPGNLAVRDYDETYTVPAWAGPGGAWALAGPLNVADLLLAADEVGTAVELLAAHPEEFKYTRVGTAAPDTELVLKPDQGLDTLIPVTLPALPDSAGVPLLVALEPTPEGLSPSGLGTSDLYAAGSPDRVLAYVEDGGVGTGGARVLQLGTLHDGEAVIGEFQDFPVLESFDGATRTFQVNTDRDAVYVRVWIEASDGAHRDLYVRAGQVEGVIPDEGPSMDYGRTEWQLLVLDRQHGTWESVLASGALSDPEEALRSTAALDEVRNGD